MRSLTHSFDGQLSSFSATRERNNPWRIFLWESNSSSQSKQSTEGKVFLLKIFLIVFFWSEIYIQKNTQASKQHLLSQARWMQMKGEREWAASKQIGRNMQATERGKSCKIIFDNFVEQAHDLHDDDVNRKKKLREISLSRQRQPPTTRANSIFNSFFWFDSKFSYDFHKLKKLSMTHSRDTAAKYWILCNSTQFLLCQHTVVIIIAACLRSWRRRRRTKKKFFRKKKERNYSPNEREMRRKRPCSLACLCCCCFLRARCHIRLALNFLAERASVDSIIVFLGLRFIHLFFHFCFASSLSICHTIWLRKIPDDSKSITKSFVIIRYDETGRLPWAGWNMRMKLKLIVVEWEQERRRTSAESHRTWEIDEFSRTQLSLAVVLPKIRNFNPIST